MPAPRLRFPTRTTLAAALGIALLGLPTGTPGGTLTASTQLSAKRVNPVTPGDFTGYGFDQCHTPSQKSMNAWWASSPFTAVGVYISGNSRACRDQPNLTADWVSKQQARGWRILPITLGPQASCQPRFPRYNDDPTIDPTPGNDKSYAKAAAQGVAEAQSAVSAAQALGISSGSTLWYDLEGFNADKTNCRESALRFLSSWTEQLHSLGYVSGVYSSAGSGIKELDDARVERPTTFTLPDAIWIARWDGVANTSTSYIRSDGWIPGRRMKQFQGGHNETWGGVTINIDRNFLDLGQGSKATAEPAHCVSSNAPKGVRIGFRDYLPLRPPVTHSDGTTTTSDPALVKAAQCLLTEADLFHGTLTGAYDAKTIKAVNAWQTQAGTKVKQAFSRPDWMTLLSAGSQAPTKRGSVGSLVRRIQRALNAADAAQLSVNGVFNAATESAVKTYQDDLDLVVSGMVDATTWSALKSGRR